MPARRRCGCGSVVVESPGAAQPCRSGPADDRRVAGRVVALQANYCRVELDASGPEGCRRLLCTRRSRLDHEGLQVWVGDRVRLEGIDWAAGRAAVAWVEPRRNLLQRPAVANVDRVVVVTALAEPDLDPLQLTRFLVAAEGSGAAVDLVLGKADLVAEPALRQVCRDFEAWGYPVFPLSTRTGLGLDDLRRHLRAAAGITVLCGPSGAGKSSLLNALAPDLDLRVAAVSGRLQRGRHTTRHVELFPLPSEVAAIDSVALCPVAPALLADTPGFNRPELPADPIVLAQAFPEIRRRLGLGACRFRNCRHLEDPGCAIGTDWPRFPLYRQCLEEVETIASVLARTATSSRRRTPRRQTSQGISRPGREDSDPDHL
jgi:ribosome biogenesis GTPase